MRLSENVHRPSCHRGVCGCKRPSWLLCATPQVSCCPGFLRNISSIRHTQKKWDAVEKLAKSPSMDFVRVIRGYPNMYSFSRLSAASIKLPFCKTREMDGFIVYNCNTLLAKKNEQSFGGEKSPIDWIIWLLYIKSNYLFFPWNTLAYAKKSVFWGICGHVLPLFANPHSLTVYEIFISLKRARRDGKIKVCFVQKWVWKVRRDSKTNDHLSNFALEFKSLNYCLFLKLWPKCLLVWAAAGALTKMFHECQGA